MQGSGSAVSQKHSSLRSQSVPTSRTSPPSPTTPVQVTMVLVCLPARTRFRQLSGRCFSTDAHTHCSKTDQVEATRQGHDLVLGRVRVLLFTPMHFSNPANRGRTGFYSTGPGFSSLHQRLRLRVHTLILCDVTGTSTSSLRTSTVMLASNSFPKVLLSPVCTPMHPASHASIPRPVPTLLLRPAAFLSAITPVA